MSALETEGADTADATVPEEREVILHSPMWRVPPPEHRFKKGQSGNPSGRRKAPREPWRITASDQRTRRMILEEAYRKVKVRDGEREVKMPANRAVFRAMANSAIAGNRVAQHLWTLIVRQAEREEAEVYERNVADLLSFKAEWEKVMRERGRDALPADLLPHPDDVYYDPRTGAHGINGPVTREEQERLDIVIKVRAMHQETYTRCQSALVTATGEEERATLVAEMERARLFFEMCDGEVPPRLQVGLDEGDEEE